MLMRPCLMTRSLWLFKLSQKSRAKNVTILTLDDGASRRLALELI